MRITILTDNPNSWFVPYGRQLLQRLVAAGQSAQYVFNAKDVAEGDVCFLLSCARLVPASVLALNKNNIVVHASDLPRGKGFSPLQWQVMEGQNDIPLTLFEVVEKVDAGPYYMKATIHFKGTELLKEMRERMALKIADMCFQFIEQFETMKPLEQSGEETFYRRRTDADDELDVNKTIAEQFDHLRTADNETYPLYFRHKGEKYILKIYKAENANSC